MRLYPWLAILVLGFATVTARAAAPATTASSVPASAATAQTAPHAGTSTTHAQEDIALPPSAVPPFAQVDTDHDGTIDWKEAQAVGVPRKIFDHDDFDGNGKLNETEWLFVRLDMTDFTPATATQSPASATR